MKLAMAGFKTVVIACFLGTTCYDLGIEIELTSGAQLTSDTSTCRRRLRRLTT